MNSKKSNKDKLDDHSSILDGIVPKSKKFQSIVNLHKFKLKSAKLTIIKCSNIEFINEFQHLISLKIEPKLITKLNGNQKIKLKNLKYLTIYLGKCLCKDLKINLLTPNLKLIDCHNFKYIYLDEKTININYLKLNELNYLFENGTSQTLYNIMYLKNLEKIYTKDLKHLDDRLLTIFSKLREFKIDKQNDPFFSKYSDATVIELKSTIENILEDKKTIGRNRFRFIFIDRHLKDVQMLKNVKNIRELALLSDLEFKIKFFNYDHKLRSIDNLDFNQFSNIKLPNNFFDTFKNIKKITIKNNCDDKQRELFIFFMNKLNIDTEFGKALQIEDLNNEQLYYDLIKIDNLKNLNIFSNSKLKVDFNFLIQLNDLNRFETNQHIDLSIILKLIKNQSLNGIRFRFFNQNCVIRKKENNYLFYQYKSNLLYSTIELYNRDNVRYQNQLKETGFNLNYDNLITKLNEIKKLEEMIICLD